MNHVSPNASLKLALSILLTGVALFSAPSFGKIACEAAARKATYGLVTYKIRDGAVSRLRLARFARAIQQINQNLRTTLYPDHVTAVVGTFGANAASYRLMALTENEITGFEKTAIAIWIHEYGHVLFLENLVDQHPVIGVDDHAISRHTRDMLTMFRLFERGAENEKFVNGYRLAAEGLADEGDRLVGQSFEEDPVLKSRLLKYLTMENDLEPRSIPDGWVMASLAMQELIADLLVEVALPGGGGNFLAKEPHFRHFNPNDVTDEERAEFQAALAADKEVRGEHLKKIKVHTVTFEARRWIAKRLKTLTDSDARWDYFEKMLSLFLDDLSERYKSRDPSMSREQEAQHILRLVRDL